MSWTADSMKDQKGKTFLITGSNTGIGLATAQALAGLGAHVIIACRNTQKGAAAKEQIRQRTPGAKVDQVSLDLASLASVRSCAAQVLKVYKRLDGLINNAGLMMPPLGRTDDGFELQFGTNLLGHFAFTGLLLPLMDGKRDTRIVSLGSVAHWDGEIDFNNLNAEKGYSRWRAYSQSKLANIMFAYELERRLRRKGSSILSLAAHPGGTKSELSRHSAVLKVISALTGAFTQSPEDGALPSLRAALDPEARGGEYYGPSKMLTMRGPPVCQPSSQRSRDEAVAARLWQECERLTGVSYR
jgi:NAD(P)-dependent dehydrogenase (short-subunit alcohol dehydrogenase family)